MSHIEPYNYMHLDGSTDRTGIGDKTTPFLVTHYNTYILLTNLMFRESTNTTSPTVHDALAEMHVEK